MRIYVGTYAKYNCGSIAGQWLDLEAFSSKEDFIEACNELHKDEADPELMFQDWEDIPDGMVGESWIDEEVWELLELDEDDREKVQVYREHVDQSTTIEDILERFSDVVTSEADYAQGRAEGEGLIDQNHPLSNYIDWEAYARDMRLNGEVDFVEVSYRRVFVFHGG